MSTLNKNVITSVVSKYIKEMLEDDEEEALLHSTTAEMVEHDKSGLNHVLESDTNALILNQLNTVEDAADVLLLDYGHNADKTSIEYKQLCRELLKARIHVTRKVLQRLQGDYGNPVEGYTVVASEEPEGSPMLSKVIDDYTEDRTGNTWTPRTASMAVSGLKMFLEFIGDKPIHELSKADVKAYRDALQKLPKNFNAQYKGKSIREVLEMNLTPELSAASINKRVGDVRSMCNFAIDMEWIDKNPAEKLKLKGEKSADKQRKPFTHELIKTIFNKQYAQFKTKAPHRYWVPLIMLCNGTRLEEAAQLQHTDIIEENGIPCLDINSNGTDKTLKNQGSRRIIPIHPTLLKLGFMEFVDTTRKANQRRLFPALEKGKAGYGSAISKWFNPRLRKLGITDKLIVLYSTRHTLATVLKAKDVQEFTISEILGHKVESMTVGRYGKKLEPEKLLEALSKAVFEEALSSLMR